MNIIFCYNKLWKLLIDKGMKRTALMEAVSFSPSTLSRLNKNMPTRMDVLAKICLLLDCGLDDIVDFRLAEEPLHSEESSGLDFAPKRQV